MFCSIASDKMINSVLERGQILLLDNLIYDVDTLLQKNNDKQLLSL